MTLVVIVAYGADRLLADCLAGIAGAGFDTVVVDNDANPTTERIVRQAGADYVGSPSNVGFAAGVNLGLAHGWDGASDVLLLNPDARVSPHDVKCLVDALHAHGPRCAAVGPLLVGREGRPQRASWPMPSPAQVWLEAFGLARLWRGRRFVTGAVLLLRGDALVELGGLDERYFLYGEEADWQMRAQRAGWSIAVVSNVTARHVGGASSSDPVARDLIFHRSQRIFGDRWYGPIGARMVRLGRAAGAVRRWVTSPQSRAEQATILRMCLVPRLEDGP